MTISKELNASMDEDHEKGAQDTEIKNHINNFCTLNDIPEGQIGKLVRYKSGKMKLVLGNEHFYDVTHGIDSTYLQVFFLFLFIFFFFIYY